MPWQRAGTVAVTSGSTTVTGTNANFVANARAGDSFIGPDGRNYEVSNIASATVLSILPAYLGPTATGAAYSIMPVLGYDKALSDALNNLNIQFGGVLAVLGATATQAGVRASLGLTNTDGLPEGPTNKYMSAAGVRGTALAGINVTTQGAVTATDTILAALGKLQASKAAKGSNADITSLTGLTTALSLEQGGTGATTAAGARAAIGASGGKNLLLNPKFKVNQRQYVSGATATAGQYTLDRWRVVTAGQSLVFAASGAGNRATFPAGGGEQVILGENIRGGVYSLSWVGTATAKVNGSAITNGGKTATLPAGANVTVTFAGGWAEDVMFELGSMATAFEDRSYDLELFLCQYYGWALAPDVADQPICSVAFTYSTTTAIGMIRFPRIMRTNPTASFLTGSSASIVLVGGGGGGIGLSNLAVTQIGRDSCKLAATITTPFTAGYGTMLSFGSYPNLFFSAEV